VNKSYTLTFATLLALMFAPFADAQQVTAASAPAAAATPAVQVKQDNKTIRQDKRSVHKARRSRRQTMKQAKSGGGR